MLKTSCLKAHYPVASAQHNNVKKQAKNHLAVRHFEEGISSRWRKYHAVTWMPTDFQGGSRKQKIPKSLKT